MSFKIIIIPKQTRCHFTPHLFWSGGTPLGVRKLLS